MLAVLLLASAGPAAALAVNSYPAPAVCSDGRGVLGPDTCARVAEILAADEQATTDEIAVAIIGTTGTSSIDNYANGLFNYWGVGKAGVDNGVLVVVALDDRTMRIEVGAGLSARLPDGQAREIVGGVMVPAFKTGDYRAGVLAGVDAVRAALAHPMDASNQLTSIPADAGYEPPVPRTSTAIVPSYPSSHEAADDRSDSNSNAGLWIAVVLIGSIVALYSWFQRASGGGGGPDDSDGNSGSGYRRRRSYRSFSSRSSGSSRRSGGFGGGRSSGGGASGKW